jgi:hypothetical protein
MARDGEQAARGATVTRPRKARRYVDEGDARPRRML